MSSPPRSSPPTASDVFSRPPPPPPPPRTPQQPDVPQQQMPVPVPAPPGRPPVAASAATASSPIRYTTPLRQQQQNNNTNMDEMCDVFLAGPSPRLERGLPPLVDPPVGSPRLKSNTGPPSTDFERIQAAAHRRSWSVVITLAHPLLHGSSHYAPLFESLLQPTHTPQLLALQTHQEELVLILHWILQALVATGARVELTKTLESWTFLDATVVPWIPWSLRIAATTARQYTTGTTPSSSSTSVMDDLWDIASSLPRGNVDDRLRVENAICNMCMLRSEWRMALGALERMLSLLAEEETTTTKRMDVLSRQGRILLQVGALDGAETIFGRVADVADSSTYGQALLPVNEGLMQFSKGQYDVAMDAFVQAIHILRPVIYENEEFDAQHQELYADTANNMALASVYSCRLDEALHLMESLVREDPTAFLTDRVAMNLCTLYELASDASQAAVKKRLLASVAKRFGLHDIRSECFRVNGQ